jgi:NADH-quinone oxidoreductase subunit K
VLVEILFYSFATILVLSGLGVILSRNPVYSALSLVLCFFTSAVLWLLIQAEFLAIALVLVYVGAVMVLFLFVVMMLDIHVEELRKGARRHAWLGWIVTLVLIAEIVGVLVQRRLGIDTTRGAVPVAADYSNASALGVDHAPPSRPQGARYRRAGRGARTRSCAHRQDALGDQAMITLGHMLALSGILFALSVAGIFINRRNVLLMLMCIELLLLSANFNFVAFSRYLGQLDGQIFVFFILTVAAAESAIGLAILIVLFRERRSIDVEDLNTLRG